MSTGQSFIGANMFAYCLNDPVNRIDASGEFAWLIFIGVVTVVALIVVCEQMEAVEESEEIMNNSDIAAMDQDTYNSLLHLYGGENHIDTSTFTLEQAIAYIRRLKADDKKGKYANWTEAEMLREWRYHKEAYELLNAIGFADVSILERLKHVDFESDQDINTYVRRLIGNVLFWD